MNKNWKKGIFFLLLFLAVMPMIHMYREQRMQKEIAEKILRFHVIANSDSREDQELKLKVRDAVGLYMKDQMKEVTNRKEAEETANANLKKIEKVAEDVIAKEGRSYTVNAFIGPVDFPVKTYGAYSFPAGTYEAVEVVIGEGAGKNWWCVMYPTLCFVDSTYQIVPGESKEKLKNCLTEEEYNSLLDGENGIETSSLFIEWIRNILFS